MEIIKLTPRTKNKSRVYCAVNGCGSKSHENLEISFHAIPKPGSSFVYIENIFGKKEKIDRLKAWQRALKIKNVNLHMRVCSLHFKRSDFVLPDVVAKKMTLKKTSIPSCNLPSSGASKQVEENKEAQRQRQMKRSLKKEAAEKLKNICEDFNIAHSDNIVPDESIETCSKNDDAVNICLEKTYNDVEVQVETLFIKPSFMNFIKTEQDLRTATGIQSYEMLDLIVDLVEDTYGNILHRTQMSLREKIIMTYVKLKQNLSYSFLAIIFNSCTPRYCQRIFYNTLQMLSKCLKIMIPWPSKEEISRNIPKVFEGFEDVRIVVDCTEVFIQAPNKLCCQEIVYSHYKSSPACKIMTGVSPGGVITFISKPFGGRTGDTEIFSQSELVNLLEVDDGVMCDRGFLIDELCARKQWKLIRPPFLKDEKQFTKSEAILTSQIAKARVHIERTNQRIKTFAVVGKTMSVKLVPVIEDIFTVICGTVNLSSSILKDDKFMQKHLTNQCINNKQ